MMDKYMCIKCRYVYSPFFGEKESNIKEGTEFEDIVNDWICPVCGEKKDEFERIQEQSQILDEDLNLDIEEKHTPFFCVQNDICFVKIGREDNFHAEEDEQDFIGYIAILDEDEEILEIKTFPKTDNGQIYEFCLEGNEVYKVIAACSMHGIWEGIEDNFLLDNHE